MGTPLGDFIRAKRDSTRPEDLGIVVQQRRRAPGLRRTELAARAGISVEYLTRIVASYEWFRAELAPVAGPEFTRRLSQPVPPPRRQLRMRHPAADGELSWNRETLELPATDEQQIVVYLPADQHTADVLGELINGNQPRLRAV